VARYTKDVLENFLGTFRFVIYRYTLVDAFSFSRIVEYCFGVSRNLQVVIFLVKGL
jgi:hypothetical protein